MVKEEKTNLIKKNSIENFSTKIGYEAILFYKKIQELKDTNKNYIIKEDFKYSLTQWQYKRKIDKLINKLQSKK
jgi:hypothetical protein